MCRKEQDEEEEEEVDEKEEKEKEEDWRREVSLRNLPHTYLRTYLVQCVAVEDIGVGFSCVSERVETLAESPWPIMAIMITNR